MLTAGKITIATAVSGILIFAFIFIFNAGKTELMKVEAQTATTTLTVLNTPPAWIEYAIEQTESSAANPTNSGSVVTWTAIGNDPNGANYYLLVCEASATPSSTNGGVPHCNGGTQWGVSTSTLSNSPAYVSTTTTEISPFARGNNNWYAWICDDDAVSARCNATSSQGLNATNSSPFFINFRPTFTAFSNTSPANPGAVVTFNSTSTDGDAGDTVRLIVCSTATFSTSTNDCGANTIATTSPAVSSDASAAYTLPSVIRDQNYNAFGYLIDSFNHTAIGPTQGSNSQITVNNVAPTVASSSIVINGGSPMIITTQGGETTGFTLDFEVTDANSCRNSSDGFEITNYVASIYHATSTNTCGATTAGDYDPNDCYTHAVATSTWNISCTASTTSCASAASSTDPTMNFTCTFPLWYITNPTDAGSPFVLDDWKASVGGVDDNSAVGAQTASQFGVEVNSASYMALLNAAIPYGQLEPGTNSGTLSASTTIRSLGNTGLDQNFTGSSMCGTFTASTTCPNSSSSTIPDNQQQFSSSSVAYGSGITLSSTTPGFLDLNIPKPISTTTPTSGVAYWGIAVPGTITLAGSYTGLNTFTLVTSF